MPEVAFLIQILQEVDKCLREEDRARAVGGDRRSHSVEGSEGEELFVLRGRKDGQILRQPEPHSTVTAKNGTAKRIIGAAIISLASITVNSI